jgi:hypothetical protein
MPIVQPARGTILAHFLRVFLEPTVLDDIPARPSPTLIYKDNPDVD